MYKKTIDDLIQKNIYLTDVVQYYFLNIVELSKLISLLFCSQSFIWFVAKKVEDKVE